MGIPGPNFKSRRSSLPKRPGAGPEDTDNSGGPGLCPGDSHGHRTGTSFRYLVARCAQGSIRTAGKCSSPEPPQGKLSAKNFQRVRFELAIYRCGFLDFARASTTSSPGGIAPRTLATAFSIHARRRTVCSFVNDVSLCFLSDIVMLLFFFHSESMDQIYFLKDCSTMNTITLHSFPF
jgi:hypothetical protein